MAFCAPMDVILSEDTVVQPDLLYVSHSRRTIVRQRIEGPPDLVVEIISGTSHRDCVEKLDLNAKYGAGEYWIVDPQTQLIEFLVHEDGRFVVQSASNECYQSPRLPEVCIQVADFWREVVEMTRSDWM